VDQAAVGETGLTADRRDRSISRSSTQGERMDHKEQHHQHHEKEREEHKKEQKEHERQEEKKLLPIHPAWLLGVGVVLIITAVVVWTFVVRP
jgi:hypothetical protein